jgi:hypothetical protein
LELRRADAERCRHAAVEASFRVGLPQLISVEGVRGLEAELDNGAAIEALRRFNDNLKSLPAERWGAPAASCIECSCAAALAQVAAAAAASGRDAPARRWLPPSRTPCVLPHTHSPPLPAPCGAEAALRPVFNELCFNLESFNPAFTACLLQASSRLLHRPSLRRARCLL